MIGNASWARQDERSKPGLLRACTWLSLRLGRRTSRLLLWPGIAYFIGTSASLRRASRAYLARALGRPARWIDVWRHVFTFAATIHDRIFLLNGRFDLFDLRVSGQECVRDALDAGRGALLIGAHLGSFEAVRTIGRMLPGLRVAIAMYGDDASRLNATLATVNPAVRQDVIALGHVDAMLKVREYVDAGAMVGLLADRTLLCDAGPARRMLDFLGAPAPFSVGPFHMAALLQRPVIFMTALYRGGNRYDICFETFADFSTTDRSERAEAVEAALERYVALLAQHCRAAPYNWFNYYDFWETDMQPAPAETSSTPEHA